MDNCEDKLNGELAGLEREIGLWKVGLSVFIILLVGWYGSWFAIRNNYSLSSDPANWGQLGDFFGGLLNPIVAFAAFYWLTRSVALQKQELADTRRELKASADALNEQVKKAQANVQIAALSSLNNFCASEISRAENNLKGLPIHDGHSLIKRRFFEERLWEFQKIQLNIADTLASGVGSGSLELIPVISFPADHFTLRITIDDFDKSRVRVGTEFLYGVKSLHDAKTVSSLNGFIPYYVDNSPADMKGWSLIINGVDVGLMPVLRGNANEVLEAIYEEIEKILPELRREQFS